MNPSKKAGLSFGLTSGIITTLGVIVGLDSGLGTKTAVIAGILTVAISDAFSDALGINISQETSTKNSPRQIWQATTYTFLSKPTTALTFLSPILTLPLQAAIITDITWGLILIITFNYHLAKTKNESPKEIIAEHLGIAITVIAITYFTGKLISFYF